MISKSQPTHGNRPQIRTFVEIGPDDTPVFEYGSIGFGPNHVYVGFDTSKEAIRKLCEKVGNSPFFRLERVEADSPYPLPDNAADTVYIGNVFGIPGAADSMDLYLLYAEGVRMVEPGGRLVILEHRSPWPKNPMEEIVRHTRGLVLSELLTPQDPGWPKMVRQYNWLAADLSRSSHSDEYILVAAKVHA